MVLIDPEYSLKLAPKQVGLFRWILLNSQQCSVQVKFYAVNTKCGFAKIYGLCLGFFKCLRKCKKKKINLIHFVSVENVISL